MRPKWIFTVFATACPYVGAFLVYPSPDLAKFLLVVGVLCWLPLFFLSLGALARFRWRNIVAFAVAWNLIAGFKFGGNWACIALGFLLHAYPIEDYPAAHCTLHDFVEDGKKQRVGWCEARDTGPTFDIVFYDTSRQFDLPASRKTPGWREAMSRFPESEIWLNSEYDADHIFGNFYSVSVLISNMRGG
jgi:hypothetical protein